MRSLSHVSQTFISPISIFGIKISNSFMRRQTDFDSVQDSCFLSRWLQVHCFKHFFRSLRRPLQTSDLFNLDTSLYPQANLERYKKKKIRDHDLSFSTLVSRILFVLAGILAIIGAGLTFTGPLVIKKIMSLLKSPKVNPQDQYTAYSYVAIWMGLYLLRIFINQYADRLFFLQAVKAEQILTHQVLSMISKLSPNIRRSNLINYLVNDIKLIFNFIKSCGGIFGSISTLVFVQIFLLLEVGWFGLVLIVVFMLVGTAQRALYLKMSKTRNKKMSLVSERIGRNIQLFSSIKQLKLLGWEELIIQKDKVYRERVDRYNSTYFTYSNIFDLVINLTPTFVFLAVLILKYTFQAHFKFDIARVYVVLAFAGLTYGPSKSLLNNVINTADAYSSIAKVNSLLKSEKIDLTKTKGDGTRGIITIDHLVSSYNSHFIQNTDTFDSERELKEQSDLNQRKRLLEKDQEKDINQGLVVKVPRKIDINPGNKVIILGEPNSGKTELINTILGNLNIAQGSVKYNGRVGYLPQKLWFQNSTARSNILFGEPINSKKLGKVYRMLGIEDEMSLLNKADLTLMNETSNISDGQKRRIALARVLYSQPDIMLLDQVFASMDQQTIALIYGSLRKHYSDKTIIMSTHITSFIRPDDLVLLMKEGKVVEFDHYQNLFNNKDSSLHQLLDKEDNQKIDDVVLRKKLTFEKKQRDWSQRKRKVRKHKLSHFVRGLLALTRGLSKQEIEEKLQIPALKSRLSEKQIPPPAKRGETVSIKYYWRFFRSAPLYLYVLLFLICLSAQAVKVFSDWWIGSLNKLPWKIDQNSALLVYIVLTAAFGLLLALAGCLSPCVSLKNSNFIGQRLRKALAYAKLSWFQTQGTTKASTRLGRDSEEIFMINNTLQNMFKTSLMFFATIIMVGLGSHLFLLLAFGVILLNITILYYFMRTERQMKALGAPYNPLILKTYNDIIQGIDQLRAFNKVEWCLADFNQKLYNYTVCKVNYKFIYNGMSIACELSSLVIIAAAAIIAVNSKFNLEVEDIAVIGTAISFSLRLTGIVTSFIRDAVGLELAMKGSSKKNFDIIDKNPVTDQTLPKKPAGWPQDNSIQFDKVSISYAGYDEPTVKEVSFIINTGQNVVICGKDGSGKSSILSAMCKLVNPVKNTDQSIGCIRIAGYDIANIGNKYVTRNNLLLGPVPFIYTATLRDNMDPFNLYTDEQIQQCLQKVELWEHIKISQQQSSNTKLSYVLTDAGKNLNLGLQQKLNIARALLYKPNILLLESATSCLDEHTQEQIERLIRQSLKQSTICVITQQIDTTMESDKVIYMSRGVAKEIGVPLDLLRNPESHLSKLVKKTSPELYLKKVVSRISSTGSIGQ